MGQSTHTGKLLPGERTENSSVAAPRIPPSARANLSARGLPIPRRCFMESRILSSNSWANRSEVHAHGSMFVTSCSYGTSLSP